MKADLINIIAVKDPEDNVMALALFDGTKAAFQKLLDKYMEQTVDGQFSIRSFKMFVLKQGCDIMILNINNIRAD